MSADTGGDHACESNSESPGDRDVNESEHERDASDEVQIVPMRHRHLRSVLRIENLVYPRPWTLPLFLSELSLREGRYYVVARVEGAVVGYGGLMFAPDEAHVTNIAVDPMWHRHKIGSRLLAHLFRESIERSVSAMTLEVRISNTAAESMYKRFGFVSAGIRRNYYQETNEDAIVMWAYDITSPHFLEQLAAIEASLPRTIVSVQKRQS